METIRPGEAGSKQSSMRMRPRRPDLPVSLIIALVAFVGWLAFLLFDAAYHGYLYTGDSNILVNGTHEAFRCIRAGQFTRCGLDEAGTTSLIGPFAPLQYIPAVILTGIIDVGDLRALELLARLNTLAFVATVALAVLPFRRNVRVWPLMVTAVAFSAATYQATSAFGEMLAACLILASGVAALQRRPVLLGITCFLATLSKETLPPFLVVLLLVAAHEKGSGWRPDKRILIAVTTATTAAVACMAGLNLFRFGSVLNSTYTLEILRTPGLARKVDFYLGIWFSPSSGIAAFWPLATILFAGIAVVTVKRFRSGGDWIPPALVVATGLAFVASLASWFAPFGWVTYGPRLAAPLIPILIVVGCAKCEVEITSAVERLATARFLSGVVALALAFVAVPQITAPWSYRQSMASLMSADAECPEMNSISIGAPDTYYACAHRFMWRTRPSTLWSASTERTSTGSAAQALGTIAAATFIFGSLNVPSRRRAGAGISQPAPSPEERSTET